MTRLQQLLGTRLPLIQAPRAGVQGHALAAAVCEAGGLGSLPHTSVTRRLMGGAARGIVNRRKREPGPMAALAPAFPLASAGLAPLRAKAESEGRGDLSALWCGQNASACPPVPVAALARELMAV